MLRTTRRIVAAALPAILFLASRFSTGQALEPPIAPETLSQLRYRHIGPVGSRVTSAAGVPGKPNLYYVGAASGGVWKTTDGGVLWSPVFDQQTAQ